LPAASVAFTWNVCEPSARLLKLFGDEQDAKAPASSAHWKLAPASELKLKLGLTLFDGLLGDAVMLAVGAVVSTVHVYEAGVPVLPAASVAFTWNVWLPSARLLKLFGDEQLAKAPASSAHWKLAPASELKLKLGLTLFDGLLGDAVMLAVGAVVSTVHV
jgi:hypothetical protein